MKNIIFKQINEQEETDLELKTTQQLIHILLKIKVISPETYRNDLIDLTNTIRYCIIY